MNKKIFITFLLVLFLLFISTSCTYANTNMMNSARNAVMYTGNAIGNVVTGTTNAVVNGAAAAGNGIRNANGDMESDATNTLANNDGMFGNTDGDYTAIRTATGNGNMLGMSDTTWTWLILGIAAIAIVSLVWYYGAQYEHKNYNND